MKNETVKISIKELEVYSRHGYFEKERKLRQRFLLDIELQYIPIHKEISNLSDCVDYEQVITLIHNVMKQSVMLLETLAQRINESIMALDSQIISSRVAIRKYPLVGRKFNYVQVEKTLIR
ncbi:MAG: dihydroneopterin aldolase [Saprospiraceae bacterium]|nr:dihydroneopterin aldolase [Saprospiraceae bacterium]